MSLIEKTQFIVLTCDKYLNTRVKSIKNSWGKKVNIVYLTDTYSDEDSIIGYNTPKTYEGIQDKYYSFFKNYDFSKYEYYFFVDDDTFVNIVEFNNITIFDSHENLILGKELHLNEDGTDKNGNPTGYPMHKIRGKNTGLPLTYPSGGAGFIITRTTCKKIQNFLNDGLGEIPFSAHSDVTVGFWLRSVGTEMRHSDLFFGSSIYNLNNFEKMVYDKERKFLTFHYINEIDMVNLDEQYNV